MVEEEDGDIGNYYGVWPTLIGIAAGVALIVFMFSLADGFTG